MSTYQDDLIQNFADLAKSRGWSLQQMADHIDAGDPSLAAELRSKAAPDSKSAPKGRRSAAAKSEG